MAVTLAPDASRRHVNTPRPGPTSKIRSSGFALVSPDYSVSDFAFLSPRPNRGLLLQGAEESDDAKGFATHLTQILKKQAQIDLETIRIKGANESYALPADLRQMYNDLKAYVGRENEDTKLL